MARFLKASIGAIFLLGVTTTPATGEGRSYFLLRSYYPTVLPFSYENLYFSYTLHFVPQDAVAFHVSLLKGSGESGFYPGGYFGGSGGGLYEKGSYYLLLRNLAGFKKIILGNYSPLFGQGLLFGGAYPMVLSTPYFDVARYRDGVYPVSSASKAGTLEGVALEFPVRGVTLRPFFSWNSFDCSAGESDYYLYDDNDWDGEPNDPDGDDFTGYDDRFPRRYSCKTNLFRSIRGEPDYEYSTSREKRNNLTEYMGGINISGDLSRLKMGGTFSYTRYDRLVDPYYDFDEGEGAKTGHYFRGKDFFASSLYFKSFGSFELFGELAGTFHRQLSYYPEFNGDFSSAFGFAGGVRTKYGNTGYVLWGAYLPANLVNPHGLELPDGINNNVCALAGVHWARKPTNVDGWLYAHRQLYDEDEPPEPVSGVSLNYDLRNLLRGGTLLRVRQELELIDNYYYAPGERSVKLSTKFSSKIPLSEPLSLTLSLESRLGGPFEQETRVGTGVSAELLRWLERSSAALFLMFYRTDDDRFAYLYPYERPFYTWSSFTKALKGTGIFGYASVAAAVTKGVTAGAKVRYIVDLEDPAENEATVYLLGEAGF